MKPSNVEIKLLEFIANQPEDKVIPPEEIRRELDILNKADNQKLLSMMISLHERGWLTISCSNDGSLVPILTQKAKQLDLKPVYGTKDMKGYEEDPDYTEHFKNGYSSADQYLREGKVIEKRKIDPEFRGKAGTAYDKGWNEAIDDYRS